jgi:hypothetical protein
MKILESALENSGKSRVLATEIEENLLWVSLNPKLLGFRVKISVWVLPENSDGFVNSNSKFDSCKLSEIPLMAKLNCFEPSMLETLSMMKLLLDQALLGTLNVLDKVPC